MAIVLGLPRLYLVRGLVHEGHRKRADDQRKLFAGSLMLPRQIHGLILYLVRGNLCYYY
jgi:hypothetical protein